MLKIVFHKRKIIETVTASHLNVHVQLVMNPHLISSLLIEWCSFSIDGNIVWIMIRSHPREAGLQIRMRN